MKAITLTAFILLLPITTVATTVFECEDSDGSHSYYDRCPPGTSLVDEKKFYISQNNKQNKHEPVVTIYSILECEACTRVRKYMEERNINFQDKNIEESVELQNELSEMAGELRVPTVVINDAIISGYDKSAMDNALGNVK